MPNPTEPDCKFQQGCHRVVPCDPGCGTPWPAPALRSRVAAALREHGMVHLGNQVPADEYDCCADAALAVLPGVPVPPTTHAGDEEQTDRLAQWLWDNCAEDERTGLLADDPRRIAAVALRWPELRHLEGEAQQRPGRSDVGTEFVRQIDHVDGETLARVETELEQSGVDTPGCDCGHSGMGVRWHDTACGWRSRPSEDCPQEDDPEQPSDTAAVQHG